jgi:hypothetical protein
MTRYKGGAGSSKPSDVRVIDDRSSAITYRGRWRIARHGQYAGNTVRYATSRGASATLRFTGRGVTWHGPTGPTRGKADVFIDGRRVKTVDLRRGSFDARAALFAKRWSSAGIHTIQIVVRGTSGRSMVAIDGFTIVR